MPRRLTLWYAFFGGPLAWSAHLLTSYPLVSWACELGTAAPLNAVTTVTALVALGAAAAGAAALRRIERPSDARAGRRARERGSSAPRASGSVRAEPDVRARFMARTGLWLGILFTFVILVEGLPPLLQDPCLAVS